MSNIIRPVSFSRRDEQDEPTSLPRMTGRVLVVDDAEARRYFIAKTLRRVGMEVLEAANGQEALAAMASQPDAVVLDVRLPDISGFEVCRLLKQEPATAAIPVLYVSALLRDEELEARLFEDGADGYIPQPIEPKHLVAQTWALVRMRRAELARRREREEALAEQQRLQRELETTRARAQRLTESGVVGTFYWDLDGTILDANDTFLAMVGYTREDLVQGRLDWRKMTPPEWEALDERTTQELAARGVGSLVEKQLFREDGSRVDVMLGAAAFDAEPGRGVTLVVDITARQQAERRLTQLMAELESSESRLRMVVVLGGFPEPLVNVPVLARDGGHLGTPDLQIPGRRPARLEYDGRYHEDPGQQAADLRRENRLVVAAGVPLLRYDRRHVTAWREVVLREVGAVTGYRPVTELDRRDFRYPPLARAW